MMRAWGTQTLVAGLLVLSVLAAPVRADVGSVSIGLAPGSPTNLIDGGANTGMFTVSVTVTNARTSPWVGVRMSATVESIAIVFPTFSNFSTVAASRDYRLRTLTSGARWAFIPAGTTNNTGDFFLVIPSSKFTEDDKTATVSVSITAMDVDPSRYLTTTFAPRNARYYQSIDSFGRIENGVGVTASGANATGNAEFTIVNGVVSLRADPSSIIEDAADGDNFTVVTLKLASQAGSSISIPYSIDNSEGDLTMATRMGTFEFSTTDTATVTITALDDEESEAPETFTLTLAPGTYGDISFSAGAPNSTVAITILDDDNTIMSLQADPSSIITEAAGSNSTVVTLTLANQPGRPITIPYSINPDPETDTVQTTSTGNFNFSANNSAATVTITALDDDRIEPPENFTLTLEPGDYNSGISISEGDPNSTVTITIMDDDGAIMSLQANPSTISENVTSGNSTVVTLELAGQAQNSINIPYTIDDSDLDLTTATRMGRFAFSANNSAATVTVTAVDDDEPESSEEFTLTLTPGTHNNVLVSGNDPNSTVAITILDNDTRAVRVRVRVFLEGPLR